MAPDLQRTNKYNLHITIAVITCQSVPFFFYQTLSFLTLIIQ